MKTKMIIKKLAMTRKASEDLEYTLTLACEDSQIMALSAYPSDTVFDVEIISEDESIRLSKTKALKASTEA